MRASRGLTGRVDCTQLQAEVRTNILEERKVPDCLSSVTDRSQVSDYVLLTCCFLGFGVSSFTVARYVESLRIYISLF